MSTRVTDAARGALSAQQLLRDMARGKAPPGTLLARMRLALQMEGTSFADAFAREIEKRLVDQLTASVGDG